MRHVITSEWLKLRRRGMAGALLAATAVGAFGAAITVLTATDGTTATPGPGGPPGGGSTVAELASSNGLAVALTATSTLLGVIALVVVAGSVAGEFSQGTLRNLLVQEPRRGRLLSGKLLALGAAVAAATLLASVAAVAAAFVLAGGRGIEAEAWTTAPGLASSVAAVVNLVVSNLGWAIFGAVLALALRSPVVAIGIGVAYALPGENILAAISSDAGRWLPGQILAAVAAGGTDTVSYLAALVTLLVYAAIALAGSVIVFARRDVAV